MALAQVALGREVIVSGGTGCETDEKSPRNSLSHRDLRFWQMWNDDSIKIVVPDRGRDLPAAEGNFMGLYFSEGVHKLFTAVVLLLPPCGGRLFLACQGLKKKAA